MSRAVGTLEWAVKNVNCCNGCEHGCCYCFSRYDDCYRWQRITPEAWTKPVIKDDVVNQKHWKNFNGTVMFPSKHDIFNGNVEACLKVLRGLLEAGNPVLIVSKPHLDVIKRLCKELESYKDRILFRFTIGSVSDDVLGFWEPNAPKFAERLESLKYAFDHGFNTSVSSEPFLDRNVSALVNALLPYVTNALWVGPMNKMETRVYFRGIPFRTIREKGKKVSDGAEDNHKLWTREEWAMWDEAKAFQTEAFVSAVYKMYKNEKKIKWKNRMKEILGLKLNDEIGLDE